MRCTRASSTATGSGCCRCWATGNRISTRSNAYCCGGAPAPEKERCLCARARVAASASLASGNRLDDLGPQSRKALQVGAPLGLETLHDPGVFIAATLALVELAWLQDLRVIDAGNRHGHLVREVGIGLPFDGALGDRLNQRAGVRDGHLPAAA